MHTATQLSLGVFDRCPEGPFRKPCPSECHWFVWCSTLRCLAAQLRLAVILPFLAGALQGLGEQQRSVAIVRSLRRAGNLAARSDLVQCKQRYPHPDLSFAMRRSGNVLLCSVILVLLHACSTAVEAKAANKRQVHAWSDQIYR